MSSKLPSHRCKPYVFLVLIIFYVGGCQPLEKLLTPLSKIELSELISLQEEFDKKQRQVDAYQIEKLRLKDLTPSYIDNHVRLKDFLIYKTDRFDDGRERACYKGTLNNTGDEIIEQLELLVKFHNSSGELINEWRNSLVFANDEYLDKGEFDENKALVLSISGRKLPLKPNKSLNLSKQTNCMKEVFLDWNEEDIKYTIGNLKLRTKVPESSSLDLVTVSVKMMDLKNRAEANNQI